MRNLRTRVLCALILLVLASTVSGLVLYPQRMDRGSLKAARLPMMLGSWAGQEVPVEDYVKQILETDDVIQRNYTNPLMDNIPVQLAVVFSSNNRRVAHPPEVCYRGSGWEVTRKQTLQLEGLPDLKRLIIESGASNKDLVIYCYKVGDRITSNYYHQQYNIVVNQLMRRATASSLIRFSSPIRDSEAETERRIINLIRLMLPEIKKTLNE